MKIIAINCTQHAVKASRAPSVGANAHLTLLMTTYEDVMVITTGTLYYLDKKKEQQQMQQTIERIIIVHDNIDKDLIFCQFNPLNRFLL